jgi:hypothetical protein
MGRVAMMPGVVLPECGRGNDRSNKENQGQTRKVLETKKLPNHEIRQDVQRELSLEEI